MSALPVIQRDDASAEFFDAAAQGRLLIGECPPCGRVALLRGRSCRGCGGELRSTAASGDAVLRTWAVTEGPTVFGYVELAEGPWFETLLMDVDPTALHDGLRLRVRFPRPEGGEAVPVFGLPS